MQFLRFSCIDIATWHLKGPLRKIAQNRMEIAQNMEDTYHTHLTVSLLCTSYIHVYEPAIPNTLHIGTYIVYSFLSNRYNVRTRIRHLR